MRNLLAFARRRTQSSENSPSVRSCQDKMVRMHASRGRIKGCTAVRQHTKQQGRTDRCAHLLHRRREASSRTASVFVSFLHSVTRKQQEKECCASVILSSPLPVTSEMKAREERRGREESERTGNSQKRRADTDTPSTLFYPALLEPGPKSLRGVGDEGPGDGGRGTGGEDLTLFF